MYMFTGVIAGIMPDYKLDNKYTFWDKQGMYAYGRYNQDMKLVLNYIREKSMITPSVHEKNIKEAINHCRDTNDKNDYDQIIDFFRYGNKIMNDEKNEKYILLQLLPR